jgi:hypothetical protein
MEATRKRRFLQKVESISVLKKAAKLQNSKVRKRHIKCKRHETLRNRRFLQKANNIVVLKKTAKLSNSKGEHGKQRDHGNRPMNLDSSIKSKVDNKEPQRPEVYMQRRSSWS